MDSSTRTIIRPKRPEYKACYVISLDTCRLVLTILCATAFDRFPCEHLRFLTPREWLLTNQMVKLSSTVVLLLPESILYTLKVSRRPKHIYKRRKEYSSKVWRVLSQEHNGF